MTLRWREESAGNFICDSEMGNFWVSYQPKNPECGEPETALVDSLGKFRILMGDWRIDYERVIPEGLAACIAFYEDNKEFWAPQEKLLAGLPLTEDDLLFNLQSIKVVLEHMKKKGMI